MLSKAPVLTLVKWTAHSGLMPSRATNGSRFLYDPDPEDLPDTLDAMPKDMFISDLVLGHIFATIESSMGRKLRRQKLVDHFGTSQLSRDNKVKEVALRLGRAYLDRAGLAMSLKNQFLTGDPKFRIRPGSLDCVTHGYAGLITGDEEKRVIKALAEFKKLCKPRISKREAESAINNAKVKPDNKLEKTANQWEGAISSSQSVSKAPSLIHL